LKASVNEDAAKTTTSPDTGASAGFAAAIGWAAGAAVGFIKAAGAAVGAVVGAAAAGGGVTAGLVAVVRAAAGGVGAGGAGAAVRGAHAARIIRATIAENTSRLEVTADTPLVATFDPMYQAQEFVGQ